MGFIRDVISTVVTGWPDVILQGPPRQFQRLFKAGSSRPLLPQEDPGRDLRRAVLESMRRLYQYEPQDDLEQNHLAPMAVAQTVPLPIEFYDLRWSLPHLPRTIATQLNLLLARLRFGLRGLLGTPDQLAEYAALFNEGLDQGAPDWLKHVSSDAWFARLRIDGPNPLVIERVASWDDLRARLALSPDEEGPFAARLLALTGSGAAPGPQGGAAALDGLLSTGALPVFVTDYALLRRSLATGRLTQVLRRDSRWRKKYLPAPVAVFAELPGRDPYCDLVPLAIRVDPPQQLTPAREPYLDRRIYWPDEGTAWELAKIYVQVADTNLLSFYGHIYLHHYQAERFVLATRRQLAPHHPIHVLLAPHTAYTLAISWFTQKYILGRQGGFLDEIYAGGLNVSRRIMINTYEEFSFADLFFERDLARRGVEAGPREFPWREDLKLWVEPVRRYAAAYVDAFYPDDATVAADEEITAWLTEIKERDGGPAATYPRVVDPGGATRAELIDVLARFLFLVGPSHAAIHFAQAEHNTCIAAFPGSAYRAPPEEQEAVTRERLLSTLPPGDAAATQFERYAIARYGFDRFGDYQGWPLGSLLKRNAKLGAAVAALQQALAGIEEEIKRRNGRRVRPYRHLLPSLVPNSINL